MELKAHTRGLKAQMLGLNAHSGAELAVSTEKQCCAGVAVRGLRRVVVLQEPNV